MTAHREVERKYEVPEGAETRIDWSSLKGWTVSADPSEHHMEAVYYDTEDMALARRLVALRRRRGGSDDGWHVKFDEPTGRQELQFPLPATPDRMPEDVRELLAGLTAGRPLRPVATLRTTRQVLRISDAAQVDVAELAVDVVEAVDERTGTERSWSEWEVELVDGTVAQERQDEIFGAVEEAIFAVGGKPSASRAKIARALGAEDGGEPAAGREEGSGGRPGDSTEQQKARKPDRKSPKQKAGKKKAGKKDGATAGDVLTTVLGELAEQLVLWDFKVRLDVPDSIHQMRVTSRSLRSLLKVARRFLEGDVARELDARLRELARELSPARDAEVVAGMLAGRAERLDGRVSPTAAAVLQGTAEEQARTAAGTVRRHIATREHLQLLADVQALAADPPLSDKCTRLSAREGSDALVRRALGKVVRVAERDVAAEAGASDDEKLAHLHDVRKAVKRARYVGALLTAAGFRPGKSVRRAASDAEEYQDALGRVMDAAVLEQWLARTARQLEGSGEDRYAVGVLHGAELTHLRAGVEHGTETVAVLLSQLREDLA